MFGDDFASRIPEDQRWISVSGYEGYYHIPQVAYLRWLVATFGPMEGSYTGRYPNAEEALRELKKDGEIQTLRELDSGKLTLGGQEVLISQAVAQQIIDWIYLTKQQAERHSTTEIKMKLVDRHAVLIGAPDADFGGYEAIVAYNPRILLFDVKQQRIVCFYSNLTF